MIALALSTHEWLHFIACLHCATDTYSKSTRVVEMKQREIIYWVVTDMQAVPELSSNAISDQGTTSEPKWSRKWTQIHANAHEDATHFVGLMRGLLPKRNDGRSSVIVPFRRRNFSVRSTPVNRFTKCH